MAKKIPFNFGAMPKSLLSSIPSKLTGASLRLLMTICDYHNHIWLKTPPLSNEKIRERSGLNIRAIQRSRNLLIEQDIISAEESGKPAKWTYRFTEAVLGFDPLARPEPVKKESKKGTSKTQSDDADVVTNDNDVATDDSYVANPAPDYEVFKRAGVRVSRPKTETKKDSLIFSSKELSINLQVDGGENVVLDSHQDSDLVSDLEPVSKVEELVNKMIRLERDWGLDQDEVTDDLFWLLVSELVEWNETMIEGSKLLFATSYDQPDHVKQRWINRRGDK